GLSQSDVDGFSRDFSALLAHTTASPPVGLLKPKTFEIGLIGGTVTVPNVARLVAEQDPAEAVPEMPNVGLVGIYSYSEKLNIEAKWIPDIGSQADGLSIGSQSIGIKLSSREN